MKKQLSNLIANKAVLILAMVLGIANLCYGMNNTFTSLVTLTVFLFIPGYVALSYFKVPHLSNWVTACLSLALSLLVMMVSGLLLNTLSLFGVERPLDTANVFLILNLATLLLLVGARNSIRLPHINWRTPRPEEVWFVGALTLLPVLAAAGAIRLNNGASNILTMILFAAIPVIFALLVWRRRMQHIYPYAIFAMALALLFSVSLRSTYVAGHDIHHELEVFLNVLNTGRWNVTTSQGDPYNACLSITILPAILAKLSTFSAPIVFNGVFQAIFALSVLPVYFVAKHFSDATKGLIAAFLFISFPTFLSDMPFLNRQEIAFVFFGLLLLVAFTKMSRIPKTALTLSLLLGLIISHYSSSYVMIGVLIAALLTFKGLSYKIKYRERFALPTLSLPILTVALLATFMWNAQVTATTGGLQQTIKTTISDLLQGSSTKDGFTQYSVVGDAPQTPEERFRNYVDGDAPNATYIEPYVMPVTGMGSQVSKIVDVTKWNEFVHSTVARVFQVLILVGAFIVAISGRKTATRKHQYFAALTVASVMALVIVTLMPRLSVDYSVIRLFQQVMIVAALPMVLAAFLLARFMKRFAIVGVVALCIGLFIHLSGFMPQALGGFRPQLSLNNAGAYYDFFYSHKSDRVASKWLGASRNPELPIFMDSKAAAPPLGYPVETGLINRDERRNASGYLYEDYVNVNKQVYRVFLDGDLVEYRDPDPTTKRTRLYDNGDSRIYGRR